MTINLKKPMPPLWHPQELTKLKPIDKSRVHYVAIHCSATNPTTNTTVHKVHQWHKDKGWSGIGYHIFIDYDGSAWEGRPLDKVGAHVANFNEVSIGICLAGGINKNASPEANFSGAQYATLLRVLKEIRAEEYPALRIQGHRDFPGVNKACPSFDVRKWLETQEGISK